MFSTPLSLMGHFFSNLQLNNFKVKIIAKKWLLAAMIYSSILGSYRIYSFQIVCFQLLLVLGWSLLCSWLNDLKVYMIVKKELVPSTSFGWLKVNVYCRILQWTCLHQNMCCGGESVGGIFLVSNTHGQTKLNCI